MIRKIKLKEKVSNGIILLAIGVMKGPMQKTKNVIDSPN